MSKNLTSLSPKHNRVEGLYVKNVKTAKNFQKQQKMLKQKQKCTKTAKNVKTQPNWNW